MHSADYKNPKKWKGRPGVIIGTANTGTPLDLHGAGRVLLISQAHDIADDMLEDGLSSVTMVQRGRTCE